MCKEIKQYVLENKIQKITFLDVGAAIYKWEIKPLAYRNIVLTNKDLSAYLDRDAGYFGATVGRVANRIKNGKFSLDGVTYTLHRNFDDSHNHGHGGVDGFSFQKFAAKSCKRKIIFSYTSRDGEENYPGEVTLKVIYRLRRNKLKITYKARVNGKSPLNITNHTYFNLTASEKVTDHVLKGKNTAFLALNNLNQVTGETVNVKESGLDFSRGRLIKEALTDRYVQEISTRRLDFTFFFPRKRLALIANDITLKLKTTYPCIHIYALTTPPKQKLINNKTINQHHALALEPSFPTDALNQPHLGNIIFSPRRPYKESITYQVKINKNV